MTIEYYFGTGGNLVQTIFGNNKKRDKDHYYNEVIPRCNYNIDILPRLTPCVDDHGWIHTLGPRFLCMKVHV